MDCLSQGLLWNLLLFLVLNSAEISLSILTAIFPREPGLASFIGAKDDGGGEW